MDTELSPLTIMVVTIASRLSGMTNDPVFVCLLIVLLVAGLAVRAWWLVLLASVGLPLFIYYRNMSWWQEVGIQRGPQDFLIHVAIVCLAFSASYGLGRFVSYLFRGRSQSD